VGNHLQCYIIGTRKALGWSNFQAGKSLGIAFGQQTLRNANLLLDKIKVVEQPFPCRRNPAVCLDGIDQEITDITEYLFVFGKP